MEHARAWGAPVSATASVRVCGGAQGAVARRARDARREGEGAALPGAAHGGREEDGALHRVW
eukprot:300446-Pleurochrysis_carterae.AAC.1